MVRLDLASGKKKLEYRTGNKYWEARLLKSGVAVEFDEIHFRNGYKKDAPFMRVKYKRLDKWCFGNTTEVLSGPYGEEIRHGDFQIGLGEILEIRNWPAL